MKVYKYQLKKFIAVFLDTNTSPQPFQPISINNSQNLGYEGGRGRDSVKCLSNVTISTDVFPGNLRWFQREIYISISKIVC